MPDEGHHRDNGSPAGGRLDQAGFARLYEQAYRTLWCIAAAVLGSSSGADDVCQDAAVIGLQKLDAFEPGTNFTAWMGQIVRHAARNSARKTNRRRGASLEAVGDVEADAPMDPTDRAPGVDVAGRLTDVQEAFDDDVVAALGGLDETARACLLLRTVMGESYAHIARTLQIPEGTAMSHVHRARRRMRQALATARTGRLNVGTTP